MTREELNAMIAASSVKVTKLAPANFDPATSASRNVAVPAPRQVRERTKPVKRNWAAQRAYDEAHGTVNGYDERIEMWKREY